MDTADGERVRAFGTWQMKAETYRANAEFCLRQAALAVRGDDIAAWQKLAESWAVLLRGETRLTAARCKLARITRYVRLA